MANVLITKPLDPDLSSLLNRTVVVSPEDGAAALCRRDVHRMSGSDCEDEDMQPCAPGAATRARQPWFVARCRSGKGLNFDLPVLDLSAGGIMVEMGYHAFNVGERVLVRLPNLAAVPAEVVWSEENSAGIAFEQLLHGAVLDHLMAARASVS